MKTTRAAVAVALALLLVACGGDDDDSASPSSSAPSSTAPSAAEIPEGRGIVTENEDGTRTVESAYGSAMVPAAPHRVASVIGDIDFEAMLALGVTPVGAGTQGGNIESGFAPHLTELSAEVEPLAWADGAPIEAIAALDPDLIFVPNEEVADQLADIAPVVPRGSWVGTEWKDDFLYVGQVLGLQAKAEGMLEEYEQRVADLSDRLASSVDGMSVLSPQVAYDHSQVYVDADDAFSSAVLTELGFTLDDVAERDEPEGIAVSFERLEELDADILFWQVRQADDGSPDAKGLDTLRANPLFERLPAVAAGRYVEVPNRPWYFPTILGAQQILDDVEAALL